MDELSRQGGRQGVETASDSLSLETATGCLAGLFARSFNTTESRVVEPTSNQNHLLLARQASLTTSKPPHIWQNALDWHGTSLPMMSVPARDLSVMVPCVVRGNVRGGGMQVWALGRLLGRWGRGQQLKAPPLSARTHTQHKGGVWQRGRGLNRGRPPPPPPPRTCSTEGKLACVRMAVGQRHSGLLPGGP